MNSNYIPIRKLTDELLREYYSEIEKELEEIVNAPSLLARVCKYYHIYQEPIEDSPCYLIFVYDKTVWFIREWSIDAFIKHIEIKQRMKYYIQKELEVKIPKLF